MSEPRVTRRKVSDYTPDSHNANQGTERGQWMIDKSVQEVGLARSIVSAADGTIPAGNKTLQAAADAGIEDVIEVETDGRALVVVRRTDWDTVDSPQARRYAYYDNRVSDVSLNWDYAQLEADATAGIDLGDLFFDDELAELACQAVEQSEYHLLDIVDDMGRESEHTEPASEDQPAKLKHEARFPLAIVLSVQQLRRWQRIKRDVLGYEDDARAFLAMLDEVDGDA